MIDTEFVGTAAHINIVQNGLVYNTNGDQKDIFKPISAASCKLNFYIDSDETDSFFTDLGEAEESRFFIEVIRESLQFPGTLKTEFRGMVLIDSVSKGDEYKPILQLEAICGLAVLKEIEYEWDGSQFYNNLQSIFYNAVLKNPVIQAIYDDSDEILSLFSKLEPETDFFADNGDDLFKTIYHNNFFFDISENIRENWDCYRVLETLLKKYMMRIVYDNGRYAIIGLETYMDDTSSLTGPIILTKDGTESSSLVLKNTFDVNDNALDGGIHAFNKGYRQVKILASKEGSNKYLARDVIWDLWSYSAAYFTAPPMLANTEFEIAINLQVTALPQVSIPYYFRDNKLQYYLSIWVKFTDQENGDVFYASIFGNTISQSGGSHVFTNNAVGGPEKETRIFFGTSILGTFTTDFKLVFPPFVHDRKVEIRYAFNFGKDYAFYDVGTNLREYAYRAKLAMGASPVGEAKTAIPFNAYVPTSKNTGTYKVDIYSSQTYGGDNTIAIAGKPVAPFFELITGWRFNSADSFESLEKAMATFMIKFLVKAQRLITLPISTTKFEGLSPNVPNAFSRFEYKDIIYIVTNIEQSFLDDVEVLKGVKVGVPSEEEVITSGIIVDRTPSTSGFQSEINTAVQQYASSKEPFHEVFDVSGTTLVLGSNSFVPVNCTYESMRKSMLVMVEGVLWEQKTSLVGAQIAYRYSPITDTITFSNDLDPNSKVTVLIFPNFEIDESITSI